MDDSPTTPRSPQQPAPPDLGADAAASIKLVAPANYESAVARLDEIIALLDTGQAALRQTLDLVREGKGLVEYCKHELDAVSGELTELDLGALVSALGSSPSDPAF